MAGEETGAALGCAGQQAPGGGDGAAPAPRQPDTARVPSPPRIVGNAPRRVVGWRGVRRFQDNPNLVREPHSESARLAALCVGEPQTEPGPRSSGTQRGPLSARAYQTTEEMPPRQQLRAGQHAPAPPTVDRGKRTFCAAREDAGREWSPRGRLPLPGGWRPSCAETEFGRSRKGRKREPPVSATTMVDRIQKEADRRKLLGDALAAAETSQADGAAGRAPLPAPAAGGAGSVYEPLALAAQQRRQQSVEDLKVSEKWRDNVKVLVGGGGGVQVGDPPLPPALTLPQRVLQRARPRPPFIQEDDGRAEYIMPKRVSSMFPEVKDGDATAPRSDYRRRVMHPTGYDKRPAWH
eukprot:TRINITY_DN51116_c0_g1_i1.p2 TRINITY_DN51116_c0_g1~~TRINITY_DN51116_c0_g1_i1.p2  ORF type:complete len:376 (+),score=81.35 TRINITY_DN51116_c0_g1_i1:78-1130(+)